MTFFEVQTGSPGERERVRTMLPMLERLSESGAERVITAWVSTWKSSAYMSLQDVPYTFNAPHYRLMGHVAEVAELGMVLAEYSGERWSVSMDEEVLLTSLILHDVDKPLLFTGWGDEMARSDLYSELPHGVVGGMLLRDLQFDEAVVSIVATHATSSPFHSKRTEAWVLHYADMFAADRALRTSQVSDVLPYYQRHVV